MCQVLLPIVFSSLLLGVLANGFTPYATHHCFNGKCSVVGVDCGDPGTPKDGTKLGETYTYMFSVHFECNPGFVMNGSHFRTCLKSGKWNGVQPTCQVQSCGDPGTPASGSRTVTSFNTDGVVKYQCDKHYTITGNIQGGSNYSLRGDAERHCVPTPKTDPRGSPSRWNGTLPFCEHMGHPVEERDLLMDFFNATLGNRWQYRTRRISSDDLFLSRRDQPDSVIGEFGINSRYAQRSDSTMDPPPAAIPYHARSVGWNTSSEHGCNTDTCHCSWYGVTCDNTGLVVRLELQANGLAGTLPDSIGGLIHLQVLDLGNNTISGTLPFRMAGPVQKHGGRPGFEQIQHINLGANMISGSVPDTFNNWARIQHLQLDNNRLSKLQSQFNGMQSLRRLHLEHNQISQTIPHTMGGLAKLELFTGYDNLLTGSLPPSFGYLAELKLLDLHNNQLVGPTSTGLGSIRFLRLDSVLSRDMSPCGTRIGGSSYQDRTMAEVIAPSGPFMGRSKGWSTSTQNWECPNEEAGVWTTECPHCLSDNLAQNSGCLKKGDLWQCTYPGGGRPVLEVISPAQTLVDVPTQFVLHGKGLSKADKIKFIHSTASCYGTSETQNTISGGSAKFIETVSSGRNTATITFTFREPARGNDGALAAVHACYLFAGSSQYTGVEGIAIKVGAPDEFAPAWARMHTDGTDPFQIWQS